MSRLEIVHVDAEREFSGGEVQVFLLLEGLRERGHSSLLVVPPGSRAEEEARDRGFASVAIEMRNDFDALAVWRIRRLLRDRMPDVVHLHTGRATWLGGLAAHVCHIPALTTRRMDRVVKRNARNRLVYGRLVRRAVAISPAVERRLREGDVPAERIRTIHSSIDPARLAWTEPRSAREVLAGEFELAPDLPLLVSVGQLHERKGIDVFLRALALNEGSLARAGWQAIVVGDGPAREQLEALARELNLAPPRLHFAGRRADIRPFLHAADVFVMPSRAEGLGVAALEAMATGRALVASGVGGLADVIRSGESGLLVAPDDAQALAGAIGGLLDSPQQRSELGRGAVARIEEAFLASGMTEAYESLYREILSEA